MEIPTLPTDSAYKFFAVGCLILAVTTAYVGYQSMSLMSERMNESITNLDEIHRKSLELEALAEANGIDVSGIDKKVRERTKRDVTLDLIVAGRVDWIFFPGRVAAVAFGSSFLFMVGFALAMWQWLRLQRVADCIAAFELAEKAEKHGIKITVNLPRNIRL